MSGFLDLISGREGLTKEFFELIKAVGEAKSKQEEDRIVTNQIKLLKSQMGLPDQSTKRKREMLMRMVYCEMLGQEAPFGYIHAVNLTQQPNLLDKRVGYLAVALTLHEGHELGVLIVNSIQRDLRSANHLEVCAALAATCKLITAEMIPAVERLVIAAVKHSNVLVRKKAVAALHRFLLRSPHSLDEHQPVLRQALCDPDPSVMAASLAVYQDLLAIDGTSKYKDLIPSFVSILKQVTESRLAREFDYHRVPAPWIQVQLLRILALLGKDDEAGSAEMYHVVGEAIRRADTGINAGYAVVYECVRTATAIYPNAALLEAAAGSVTRFITSDNHNLKYLGITALGDIVGVYPSLATQHQMIVIEALEDPDETIKRKTLDLLYKMTNPANVVVITEKLLTYLRTSVDEYLRKDLVGRITAAAERYAPNNEWFINTMNAVFELGGDLVAPEVAHNLLRLIAEGSGGEDDDADNALRGHAAAAYLELMDKPMLSPILVEVIAWVLGEYGYLAPMGKEDILRRLCDLMERPGTSAGTRAWIVSAMSKLVAQAGVCPVEVQDITEKYASSSSVDLQQRVYEFNQLVQNPATMVAVLPVDASCEELEVDPNLPALNDFVQAALASGSSPYSPPNEIVPVSGTRAVPADAGIGHLAGGGKGGNSFRFEAYAKPEERGAGGGAGSGLFAGLNSGPAGGAAGGAAAVGAGGVAPGAGAAGAPKPVGAPAAPASFSALSGNSRKWGRSGYAGATAGAAPPSKPATSTTPAPATAAPWSGLGAPKRPGATPAAAAAVSPEKAKLANALFSGLSAGGATAGIGKKPAAKAPVVKQATVVRPTPTTSSAGAGFTATSAPAASPPPVSTPSPAGNLLDLDQGVSSVTAPMGGLNLMDSGPAVDLMGDDSSAGVLPVGGAAIVGGGGVGGGVKKAGGITPGEIPGSLAVQIGDAPHTMVSEVGGDGTMSVQMAKYFRPDSTLIVIWLVNSGGAEAGNVVTAWQLPRSLPGSFTGSPTPSVSGNQMTLSKPIAPGGAAVQVARLNSAGWSSKMPVTIKVSYWNESEKRSGFVNVSLSMEAVDLMRPLTLTTDAFGAAWGSHGAERKGAASGRVVGGTQGFLDRMSQAVGLTPVQIIGAEGIAAGSLLGGAHQVLVHGMVDVSGSVVVTVRSKDANLTELVYQACLGAFGQ